jgi:hypothetical protein
METLSSVLKQIRELSFDRYVTATFFIRTLPDANGSVSNPYTLLIKNVEGDVLNQYLQLSRPDDVGSPYIFQFADYLTLDDLLKALTVTAANIEVVYSGSFISSESTYTLQGTKSIVLNKYFPIYRQVYFSDDAIIKYLEEYAMRFLKATWSYLQTIDWDTDFENITPAQRDHMTYWTAFKLVGKRRLYELAGSTIQSSSLGGNPLINGYNGTSYVTQDSFSLTPPGETTTVQVADVFTLTDDSGSMQNSNYSKEIPQAMLAPWEVGSDNVLMDYYSYWYRLQLWLRDRFEDMFGDNCLRNDNIIIGNMQLHKPENLYAYFDNYPWTHSPYPRGIRGSHIK